MSDLTLFENMPALPADVLERFSTVDQRVGGEDSASTRRRISINGGRFREIVNGKQVAVSKEDWLDVVIVDGSAIMRNYYSGQFDPSNPAPPDCWSLDCNTPAPEVRAPKATRCMGCQFDVAGSGFGSSRACRRFQRLAVVLDGKLDTIYQLQIPAMSIFGQPNGQNLPLRAYMNFLRSHGRPSGTLVTRIYFDTNSSTPKLFFKPQRVLARDEVDTVFSLIDLPETKQAIEMSVASMDGVVANQQSRPAANASPRGSVEADVEEDAPQPRKRATAAKPQPAEPSKDLAALVDDWDD